MSVGVNMTIYKNRKFTDMFHMRKRKRQEPIESIPLEGINTKGEWLTDEHIRFAQRLLQQQFPDQDGFFNPLCG